MRLAFVVQRYGLEVHGGSEYLCRMWAERLAQHHQVDVITTCARDYLTWEDFYTPGVEMLNGVRVQRFAVDAPRDINDFNAFCEFIYNHPHTEEQEIEWMRRGGPYSTALFQAIEAQKETFDLFIFMTYLYCTTFFGMPLVRDKAVLVPTAHDEPPIYLSIFKRVFNAPIHMIYNTPAEGALVRRLFAVDHIPSSEVGIGVDLPLLGDGDAERQREPPLLLYVGRVHTSKGCEQLFDYFVRYRNEYDVTLQLAFVGRADVAMPPHPDVLYTGFISEDEKQRLLHECSVFVLPSPFESLSIVCLEAWAAGKPTLVNAHAEVLREQTLRSGGGLFYENYDQFATCLDILLQNNQMRRSMGQQGRRFVERSYNWQAVERRLESALKEARHPSMPANIERATWDHIVWAYHLLLDRPPEDEAIITTKLRILKTVRDLRSHLILSEEFRIKNPQLSHINRRTIVIKELENNLRLFVDLFDSMIGMSIVRGLYESSEIAFVRQTVKPGQTVLDIGANIGFFTINMAAMVGETGKVYAFEPLDMNADLLQRSIAENHFDARVVLECAALGDTSGPTKILFLTQRTNSGGVHLFQHDTEVPEGHEIKEVPMLTLDAYPLRRPVDFIKIDIEGAEPLALRGGEDMLRTDRPIIMSEIHPQLIRSIAGCSPAEFIAEMDERGYNCYVLEEGEMTTQIHDVADSRVWTVVFVPRAE